MKFLACLALKTIIIDPINIRLNFKYIALNGGDYLSQEIRLL